MKNYNIDFVIIGSGIIGLTMAKSLIGRYPESKIAIVEKESEVGQHASGLNSGVLHAGIYYAADSLKAKFCKQGNLAWTGYCQENGLRINQCGKVIVAKDEAELKTLHELEKRALNNGATLKRINEKELAAIEPNAVTYGRALHVPSTAVVDPKEICLHLKNYLQSKGVQFFFSSPYLLKTGRNQIQAGQNHFTYDKLINCAGLYADKIAHDFGCSEHYTIIPFKGLYLKYTLPDKPVKTNIYPVPNLANPFLGVHFTVTVDGNVKIGPTATPAFWREHYDLFGNFNFDEMSSIIGWEAKLFLSNSFGFRDLAIEEIKKYKKAYLIDKASYMVSKLNKAGFSEWSKPGIRAQLLDKRDLKLVQDFVVEKGEDSIHILNAVSPAFTCSIPFSDWVIDNYLNS